MRLGFVKVSAAQQLSPADSALVEWMAPFTLPCQVDCLPLQVDVFLLARTSWGAIGWVIFADLGMVSTDLLLCKAQDQAEAAAFTCLFPALGMFWARSVERLLSACFLLTPKWHLCISSVTKLVRAADWDWAAGRPHPRRIPLGLVCAWLHLHAGEACFVSVKHCQLR